MPPITQREFEAFQRLIYDAAGIHLSDAKKCLVSGRLAKRLAARGVGSYMEYFQLLTSGEAPSELQTAVDLLTTNETYFFREPKHFQFLQEQLRQSWRGVEPYRVWSAAASSGEEAYSVAMLLEDRIPGRWEVIGSDISARVLETARQGRYPMSRIKVLIVDDSAVRAAAGANIKRLAMRAKAGRLKTEKHCADVMLPAA